ncbi:hypothetical protein HPB50_026909 [Hyalomma asiaticum]|uniref:Uncharacterized protein n=1 Tax=Hyalomma asiaticum TaxID=266040 RepID=A0ACB7S3P8_HYAAI|nr:hypothetical protein HPB50_026909 [Hyalomma asiaticum]
MPKDARSPPRPHHRKKHRKRDQKYPESDNDANAPGLEEAAKEKSPPPQASKKPDTTKKPDLSVPGQSLPSSPVRINQLPELIFENENEFGRRLPKLSWHINTPRTRRKICEPEHIDVSTAITRIVEEAQASRQGERQGDCLHTKRLQRPRTIRRRREKRLESEEDVELPGIKGMPVSFLVFLLIVAFVVVGFIISALVMLFRAAVSPKKPEAFNCSTASCLAYGRFLLEGVLDDVHPCDDFYKHVCGRWDAKRAGSFLDYARNSFYRAVVRAARSVKVPRVGQTPAHKAAQFFQSCDDVLDRDQTAEARAALNRGGISWPREASEPDVLSATLYASLDLFLPAVLHVTIAVDGAGQTALHLRRADTFDTFAEKQAQLLKLGQFDRYFATLRDNFASRDASSASVEDAARWERTITPELRKHYRDPETGTPATMEQLESATRGFARRSWRDALGKHLANASSGDSVVVRIFGKAFVETFFKLMRSFGERVMHRYVSWYVVQDIAKYANLELAVNHYGSEELARSGHSIHCARMTERLAGISFAIPQLGKSLPTDAAQAIASMAQILALVTEQHLSAWQNVTLRSRAPEVSDVSIRNEEINGDNSTAGLLVFRSSSDVALQNTTDMSKTFLPNWILANRARRKSAAGDSSLDVQINFNMPALVSSMFYGNTVSLRPWYVLPPVFTPGLPPGFLYGGLGGQLVSALLSLGTIHRESKSSIEQGDDMLTSNQENQRFYSAAPLFSVGVLISALNNALMGNASRNDDYKQLFAQRCYMRADYDATRQVQDDPQ